MPINQATVQQKADALFAIYLTMGTERSLEGLLDLCTNAGLKTSISTLKNYSTEFNWQQRLSQAQSVAQSQQITKDAEAINHMNERQAQLGRALQGISGNGLTQLQYDMQQQNIILGSRDIVALADVGVKLERLARGEATTRQDVMSQVLRPVIINMVNLFQTVNKIDDPRERVREFGVGADYILEQAVGQYETEE